MSELTHAAVLGAGSWGTVFAKILADAGNRVRILARRQEVVDEINDSHTNSGYLGSVRLPDAITATADPAEAISGADLVAVAVPSQTLRDNLAQWKDLFHRDATLISLMKGIELGTTKRMSEVIGEVCDFPVEQVALVTGPNLAPEIAAEQLAAAVVACTDEERARRVQKAVATRYFRPYTNTDVVGCELGGAVKNVIGLAYGMATGMGMGDNTKATLITRGLAETQRLGVELGADPLTFAGLAGLGDLVATCNSRLGRNRTFGEELGKGNTMAQAQEVTRQTAEGVKSCRSIRDLASRHNVEMPITEQVERVCHEGVPVKEAVAALMARQMKPE